MKKVLSILLLAVFVFGIQTNSYGAFPVKTEKVQKGGKTLEKVAKIEKLTVKNESNKEEAASTAAGGGKSQVVALILSLLNILILPGSFHNFYLGRSGKALLQILAFVAGLGIIIGGAASTVSGGSISPLVWIGYALLLGWWIWSLVDLIRIIGGGLTPANGDYSKTL